MLALFLTVMDMDKLDAHVSTSAHDIDAAMADTDTAIMYVEEERGRRRRKLLVSLRLRGPSLLFMLHTNCTPTARISCYHPCTPTSPPERWIPSLTPHSSSLTRRAVLHQLPVFVGLPPPPKPAGRIAAAGLPSSDPSEVSSARDFSLSLSLSHTLHPSPPAAAGSGCSRRASPAAAGPHAGAREDRRADHGRAGPAQCRRGLHLRPAHGPVLGRGIPGMLCAMRCDRCCPSQQKATYWC